MTRRIKSVNPTFLCRPHGANILMVILFLNKKSENNYVSAEQLMHYHPIFIFNKLMFRQLKAKEPLNVERFLNEAVYGRRLWKGKGEVSEDYEEYT